MTVKTKQMIKISQLVNPHFKKMWTTTRPYVIAKGGRGSFKSSTISLKLLTMLKKQAQLGHKVNVVCIRENTVNLRDSVYGQICWAIDMLNKSMNLNIRFHQCASPIFHRAVRFIFTAMTSLRN
ncbi:hypothetical protein HMPREF9103_00835 [Lentilactobacillus parafarraginis F0439]|uniref:Phage terminase large subunit N-terminal domain-containing protein n=1 Tax=Lentilactobacillus parafarraginis F0439 TaxID=797515 RepID=G9ZM87_9LACO|nr:hypothetical protein HMPREF9103_00835 [Lentilactobacillus parafarraginis F0439]